MTRFSRNTAEILQQSAMGAELDFSISDGMSASFEDSFRALPTQSMIRGVQNYFDTSAKIDPLKANEEYGLSGTDAAFKEGDDVTIERAKAVSDDYFKTRMNSIIMDTVNEDSPVMGRVSQFAAGVAAGFTDPALMAINVAGGFVVGAGAKALANSSRGMQMISRMSPSMGKALTQAYSDGIANNLGAFLAREGIENLVTSTAEETVNFVGIGEERLSRSVTAEESMINIVAGTLLGTIGTTALSKEGRTAVKKSLMRQYGDAAPDMVKADLTMSTIEAQLGIERSKFDQREGAVEVFGNKSWYDQEYSYAPPSADAPAYLSINNDGAVYNYSVRGKGIVLTDSKPHAYNTGTSIREIQANALKVMSSEDVLSPVGMTPMGVKLKDSLISKMVDRLPEDNLSRMFEWDTRAARLPVNENVFVDTHSMAMQMEDFLATMMREDVRIGGAEELAEGRRVARQTDPLAQFGEAQVVQRSPLDVTQVRSRLNDILEGKDLDGMINELDQRIHLGEADIDVDDVVDEILDELGYDGYRFVGKNGLGEAAYNGTYVKQSSQGKLKSRASYETPKPSDVQMQEFRAAQAQRFSDYADNVQNRARALTQTAEADVPVLPEGVTASPMNPAKEALMSDPETARAVRELVDRYERRAAEAGEDGVQVDPREEADYRLTKKLLESEDMAKITDEEFSKVSRFIDCIRGN